MIISINNASVNLEWILGLINFTMQKQRAMIADSKNQGYITQIRQELALKYIDRSR